jgi:hypothetical protein
MSANERAEAFLLVIKRLAKWAAIGIAGLLTLVFIFYVYTETKDYYDNRPKVINELNGIKLGEKEGDFIFKNPHFSLHNYELEKFPEKIENEHMYDDKEALSSVVIVEGKIDRLVFSCFGKNKSLSVNGIACESRGEEIVEKFGDAVRVLCEKDKKEGDKFNFRVYDVAKFGVRYLLVSNEVMQFVVSDPVKVNTWVGINWSKCD